MRDALIAYDAGNYSEAISLFNEVRQNATKGFNMAQGNMDSLLRCTQLKITAVYIIKSFEDGEMKTMDRLSENRKKELAR